MRLEEGNRSAQNEVDGTRSEHRGAGGELELLFGEVIDLLGLPPGIEDADLELSPLRDPAKPADLDG